MIDYHRWSFNAIYFYHSKQIKKSHSFKDQLDSKFYIQWNPIENVGLYIPGGMASYPSTVLMTTIPAKIAKVPNIMICVPSQSVSQFISSRITCHGVLSGPEGQPIQIAV